MKYIAAFAALLSVVVADEFGTASVYCGSSVSSIYLRAYRARLI